MLDHECAPRDLRAEGLRPVLVTGATGKIGRELVLQLLTRGCPVRAFVRSAEKAAALERSGVEAFPGDFDDVESVERAMEGARSLFLLSPIHRSMAEREEAAMRAAKRAGLSRVVLLSGRGAEPDSPSSIIRMHARSELFLKASGLGYTILRPDYFMQNLLGYLPSMLRGGVFSATFLDAPYCMVDCRDIAAVAAAALVEDGHAGKSYDLTGPEALSLRSAAGKLALGLGRSVECSELTQSQLREGLLAMGAPGWLADELSSAKAEDGPCFPTSAVQEALGRPPLDLDRFIADCVPLFLDACQ